MQALSRERLTANAYRILGLPAGASQADIDAAARRMRIWSDPSQIPPTPWDLVWLGPLSRSRNDFEQAVSRLNEPASRVRERVLWFASPEVTAKNLTPRSADAVARAMAASDGAPAGHDSALAGLAAAFFHDPSLRDAGRWGPTLSAVARVADDPNYRRWLLAAEEDGDFEKRATPGEVVAALRDLPASACRFLAEAARGALDRDDLAAYARCVQLIRPAAADPEAGEQSIAGLRDRVEDLLAARCRRLTDDAFRRIRWDRARYSKNLKYNKARCVELAKDLRTQIDPLYDAFVNLADADRVRRVNLAAAQAIRNLGLGWRWSARAPHRGGHAEAGAAPGGGHAAVREAPRRSRRERGGAQEETERRAAGADDHGRGPGDQPRATDRDRRARDVHPRGHHGAATIFAPADRAGPEPVYAAADVPGRPGRTPAPDAPAGVGQPRPPGRDNARQRLHAPAGRSAARREALTRRVDHEQRTIHDAQRTRARLGLRPRERAGQPPGRSVAVVGVAGGRPRRRAAPARHALRKIEDFLRSLGSEAQSMDGQKFDPGLAVRVVDAFDDPALPTGETEIAETLSPMVLWKDRVVKPADVVTRRGTGRKPPGG